MKNILIFIPLEIISCYNFILITLLFKYNITYYNQKINEYVYFIVKQSYDIIFYFQY